MYELEHLSKWDGQPPVVFNPHNKPVEELPFIYGFCNGGQFGWMEGVLVSQDGHEEFQKHYPDGCRMEFVPHAKAKDHAGLKAAMDMYILNNTPTETEQ